jgi:hypothetical protein
MDIYIVRNHASPIIGRAKRGANAFLSKDTAQTLANKLNGMWQNKLFNLVNGSSWRVTKLTIYEET